MKIFILPSAIEDLLEGYKFYEFQANGLGEYFLESLISDIDSLKIHGGVHIKVFGYYRLLSKRFPYAIYYKKESDTIYVTAVLDCRRNPEWVRKRLEKNKK